MQLKNRTWLMIVVICRVLLTLGIMMTLFLGMWIGYFTILIILIGAFSLILAISDIGILFSLKKRKKINGDDLSLSDQYEDQKNESINSIHDEY
ncbi:MAG: hypothetical protein GYA45_03660 [Pelolinea sp.]|nr:hypothetical protein [Pelolinea sp.]